MFYFLVLEIKTSKGVPQGTILGPYLFYYLLFDSLEKKYILKITSSSHTHTLASAGRPAHLSSIPSCQPTAPGLELPSLACCRQGMGRSGSEPALYPGSGISSRTNKYDSIF